MRRKFFPLFASTILSRESGTYGVHFPICLAKLICSGKKYRTNRILSSFPVTQYGYPWALPGPTFFDIVNFCSVEEEYSPLDSRP